MAQATEEVSSLCEACSKVLEFDDTDFLSVKGGEIKQAADGNATIDWGNEAATKWWEKDRMTMLLNYQREDSRPDCPVLLASANNGCNFCQLLYRQFSEKPMAVMDGSLTQLVFEEIQMAWFRDPDVPDEDQPLTIFSGQPVLMFLKVFATEWNRDDFVAEHELRFQIAADQGPCATWLRISRLPLHNDILDQGLPLLQGWIDKCTSDCHPPSSKFPLPTRLLDVGDDCRMRPRLVETANLEADDVSRDMRYAILSYCWGKKPALRTTRATIGDHQEIIEETSFPRSCWDAVRVTRSLGLRYLWIDALCIVQDDSKDWDFESARMADAYRHAYITIMDLRGASSHDGFLQSRADEQIRVGFQSTLKPEIKGSYWIRAMRSRYGNVHQNEFMHQVHIDKDTSTWNTRGWTYQEDILSTRRLLFGAEMTHFVCGSKAYSEDGQSEPWLTDDWMRRLRTMEDTSHMYDYCWSGVMVSISERQFTYTQDKLPAISALASSFHDRTADQYLAGLWKSDLQAGLLWYPRSKRSFRNTYSIPGNPDYIAPSWAWPANPGAIHFLHLDEEPYLPLRLSCAVIAATAVPTGLNMFGRISGGSLTLRGSAWELPSNAVLRESEASVLAWDSDGSDGPDLVDCSGNVDYTDGRPHGVSAWPLTHEIVVDDEYVMHCMLDWEVSSATDADYSSDDVLNGWQSRLLAFVVSENVEGVLRTGVDEVPNFTWTRTFGLLLLPTGSPEEWQRVGIFRSLPYQRGGRKFFDCCKIRDVNIV